MIRSLTVLAAEGSPLGDAIRENDTVVGFGCIGLVILVVVLAVSRGKK